MFFNKSLVYALDSKQAILKFLSCVLTLSSLLMLSFFLCYYHQSFMNSNPFISRAHIALLALHIVRDTKRRKDVSLPVSATEFRGGRWARVGRGTTFQSKWFHQSCPDYLFCTILWPTDPTLPTLWNIDCSDLACTIRLQHRKSESSLRAGAVSRSPLPSALSIAPATW